METGAWKPFLAAIFLSVFLTGCGNLLYLTKLGWHQSSITLRRVSVQKVLEDERVGGEEKEKIRYIQEVKRYGEEHLGLVKSKSYSKYVEVEGPVLWVVTASEKDRLQAYGWKFPVIGKVTYKGFFTEKDALKEKALLEAKGYDTFVQQAEAYSTLGWLKDPIFSSMLQWDEVTLADLILHEMTHATLYFKNQTDLNEQIATFIGIRGSMDFLKAKYGPESKNVMDAALRQEDDLFFGRWIDQTCARLSAFYQKEISKEEKLKRREEIFQSVREEFKVIQKESKTIYYQNFEIREFNNAVLLALYRYYHQAGKLKILYDQRDQDLRKVIEYLKQVQSSGDVTSLQPAFENPESRSQKSE